MFLILFIMEIGSKIQDQEQAKSQYKLDGELLPPEVPDVCQSSSIGCHFQ